MLVGKKRKPVGRYAAGAVAGLAVALAAQLAPGLAGTAAADTTPPVRHSVSASGNAPYLGSTDNVLLNKPVVDIAGTGSGQGYWQLAGDGGVFSFGDARFFGSTGNIRLNQPAVQMAPTPTRNGYWFVANDGGIFAFGDARFFGSAGGMRLNRPVIGMLPTATGNGYWLVAEDGGVFAYGDARFRGSLGNTAISAPIVALAPTLTNNGYWLLGRDGAVYTFGDAPYLGGARDRGFVEGPRDANGLSRLTFSEAPAVDIAAFPDGNGYAILLEDGLIAVNRDGFVSSPPAPTVDFHAGSRAVGLALTPDGNGMWVATSGRAQSSDIVFASGTYGISGRPGWSRCRVVTWRFDSTGAIGNSEAFFAELFDYASRVTGMQFRYGGPLRPGEGIGGDTIVVGWQPMPPFVAGLGGFSYPPARGSVRLSTNNVTSIPAPGSTGDWGYNGWGSIAIHELGHAIGLAHTNDKATVMYPTAGGANRFMGGDLAGLRELIGC